jgi:hypothetical protein
MNRDLIRSRTGDYYVPIETTPIPQRKSSRQSVFMVKFFTEKLIL